MADTTFENFERAFDDHSGSCRRQCACGVTFYDDANNGYSWDEGELDALRADRKAVRLDYAVGYIAFEGAYYVPDCKCWRPRAKRIIAFLQAHDSQIAEFLSLEKQRKTQEANTSPVVTV